MDRKEPSEAWLPGGSATFLAIIIAIVLINMVFPLSRNWTIGLSIVLVIAGLVVVALTSKGWLDWRLFRDTAEGESVHAHGHLDYLKAVGDPATDSPIGSTDMNLKSAVAGEIQIAPDGRPTQVD